MSELADKVDLEVGNDTEQSRINFIKYVNYGRQLEREDNVEQGLYTKDVVEQMISEMRKQTALSILTEIDALESQVAERQAEVESSEDEQIESLKRQSDITKPEVASAVSTAVAIFVNVDERHSEIIHNVKTPGMQTIKAKYGV